MADQPDPRLGVTEPEVPPAPAVEPRSLLAQRRRRWLGIVAVVVLVAAVLALLYHFLIGIRHVSTDNAYVGADVAQVTPLVAGQVTQVAVQNTQFVHKGDLLVTIDPADARIAAERLGADLLQAQRQFQQNRATGGALQAQVAARDQDIAQAQAQAIVAQANLDKARIDLSRRENLAKSGAVSGDELTSARTSFAAAKAQLVVAQAAIRQGQATKRAAIESFNANQALVQGSMAANPDVAAARARVDQAKLDLSRTVIRAPFDGIVAQRAVQIGQRVAAGTVLMTVVPVDRMYVDANFKEGQLARVRIGQPARLSSDIYGGRVEYHGHVAGLAGGTGSAFALIPAQNATGNWIKVVQRLPVRIALDPQELKAHPLRVGLSMDATVDVGN